MQDNEADFDNRFEVDSLNYQSHIPVTSLRNSVYIEHCAPKKF